MEVTYTLIGLVLLAHVAVFFVLYKIVQGKFVLRKKYPTPAANGAVLITGASSGIGLAATKHLAGTGFHVYATVRSEAKAEQLLKDLRGEIPESAVVEPVILDVTDQASIDAAVEGLQAKLENGLVGLVNNAGFNLGAYPMEFVRPEELQRQLDVNVIGQVRVLQAFLPMIRKAGGRVVFMGSVAGKIAANFQGPYAASKFAIEAIADSLRRELSPWNISVSVINAGEIKTPLLTTYATEAKNAKANLVAIDPKAGEYYGAYYDAFKPTRDKYVGSVRQTNSAIEHALAAPRPKTRYAVASKAMMARLYPSVFAGLPSWSLLPDRYLDMEMSKSQWPRRLLKKKN